MMIIDVRKLNAQKQYTGSMEFSYSAPKELIDIPFVKFASLVKVCFDYELFEDDAMEVRGSVSFKLAGQCSRCLKETENEVVGEFDALFEPFAKGEDYTYANGIINLTDAVNDAVMAAMPFTLSCGEDCKGLSYSDETAQ